MSNFFRLRGDGKNLDESFAWRGMSKNVYIQFFESQMQFPMIHTPWIWEFSPTDWIYRFERKFKKNSGEI